jgi:YHS domain-containing protein
VVLPNQRVKKETNMDWLLQNWLWIVLATGVLAYLMRRNWMRQNGSFDSIAGGTARGSGMEDHRDHDRITNADGSAGYRTAQADTPGAAIDPVAGTAVQISAALTSVYGGRIYYFGSAESRARFEAAPGQFVRDEEGRGLPAQDSGPVPRRHHRHGC